MITILEPSVPLQSCAILTLVLWKSAACSKSRTTPSPRNIANFNICVKHQSSMYTYHLLFFSLWACKVPVNFVLFRSAKTNSEQSSFCTIFCPMASPTDPQPTIVILIEPFWCFPEYIVVCISQTILYGLPNSIWILNAIHNAACQPCGSLAASSPARQHRSLQWLDDVWWQLCSLLVYIHL